MVNSYGIKLSITTMRFNIMPATMFNTCRTITESRATCNYPSQIEKKQNLLFQAQVSGAIMQNIDKLTNNATDRCVNQHAKWDQFGLHPDPQPSAPPYSRGGGFVNDVLLVNMNFNDDLHVNMNFNERFMTQPDKNPYYPSAPLI